MKFFRNLSEEYQKIIYKRVKMSYFHYPQTSLDGSWNYYYYLQLECLRFYASFENLNNLIKKNLHLPSYLSQ